MSSKSKKGIEKLRSLGWNRLRVWRDWAAHLHLKFLGLLFLPPPKVALHAIPWFCSPSHANVILPYLILNYPILFCCFCNTTYNAEWINLMYFFFIIFRHVILGFTKNGRYLISYCLKIENDDSSPLPCYVYSLHWWEFNQHRPLIQVCINLYTLANGKNGFYKQFTLTSTVSLAF